MNILKKTMPQEVRRLLMTNSSAWLAGSGARYLSIGGDLPRDWDIFITDSREWNRFTSTVSGGHYQYSLNTFGGFKLTLTDSVTVDVWHDSLDVMLSSPHTHYLYNMYQAAMWERV